MLSRSTRPSSSQESLSDSQSFHSSSASAVSLGVWDRHPRNPLPEALLFEQHLVVKEPVSSLDAWRVPLKVSAELLTVGHVGPPWLLQRHEVQEGFAFADCTLGSLSDNQ